MQLHSRTYGESGPHVIILHGLFGMSDNWHSFARSLSDAYRVHTLDLRNHGRSPHHVSMTYPDMAADVVEYLEAEAIPSAAVLGHSMGGKVAMELALRHSLLVNGLVVVDSAPRTYQGLHDPIFDALFSLPLESIATRGDALEHMKKHVKADATAQFLLKNLARTDEGEFAWKLNLQTLHAEYENILAGISGPDWYDGPALFIRGGRGEYILPTDKPTIEALFPKARIETIEEAGHWVHADSPEEFEGLVRGFLLRIFT